MVETATMRWTLMSWRRWSKIWRTRRPWMIWLMRRRMNTGLARPSEANPVWRYCCGCALGLCCLLAYLACDVVASVRFLANLLRISGKKRESKMLDLSKNTTYSGALVRVGRSHGACSDHGLHSSLIAGDWSN